ncbi:MAG: hypothetical protein E7Z86_09865 [Methanosphaera stadtmanae]|jgi:hypothetical protein|nr:hypothetical protein [Methanosphaera stadtmanae]
MKVDDNTYKLYEHMYGKTFNKTLLIGTKEEGYTSFSIKNVDDICDKFEEFHPQKEIFISGYDFNTEENITRWMRTDLYKFEQSARKNCIILRFRNNSSEIREEFKDLTDIQKFMFIRRTINLGSDKAIIEENKKTFEYIQEKMGIIPFVTFNGMNECSMYIYFNEIDFNYPTETLYIFQNLLENKLELKHLTYKEIEPFSQIIALPATQHLDSKLYAKPYDINWSYEEIIKNSTDRSMNNILPDKNQDSSKLESILKRIDEEIKISKINRKSSINLNLDDL